MPGGGRGRPRSTVIYGKQLSLDVLLAEQKWHLALRDFRSKQRDIVHSGVCVRVRVRARVLRLVCVRERERERMSDSGGESVCRRRECVCQRERRGRWSETMRERQKEEEIEKRGIPPTAADELWARYACMLRVCVDVWMGATRTCTDLEEQTDVLTMLHEVGAILYAQTGLLEYVFRT
jgi:hypothetical protein